MALEIDLSDIARRIVRVADFPDLARAPIRGALRESATVIAADWRASIQTGGGRPSLPGAPPHSQSGNLAASITTRPPRAGRRDERAYVLARWPLGAHAPLLESGTAERVVRKTGQHVGRVLPRPSLLPAAGRRVSEFVEGIEAAIAKAAAASSP